jgi:hypothetical protein
LSDRWIPLLAAVLGVLGGVAGAAVGGYVANEGQEQQFEHERAMELRDQRTATYVKFVEAVEAEHFEAPETADRAIRTAEAEVALVAFRPAIRQAASELTDYVLEGLSGGGEQEYARRAEAFLELAHDELDAVD